MNPTALVEDREPQHPPDKLRVFEEHDQTWVECLHCGRQWAVHETLSETGAEDFDLEQVSDGDGFCDENPAD